MNFFRSAENKYLFQTLISSILAVVVLGLDIITDGGVGEVIEEPVQHEHRREGQPSEGEYVVEGNLDNSLLLSPEMFHFKSVIT